MHIIHELEVRFDLFFAFVFSSREATNLSSRVQITTDIHEEVQSQNKMLELMVCSNRFEVLIQNKYN